MVANSDKVLKSRGRSNKRLQELVKENVSESKRRIVRSPTVSCSGVKSTKVGHFKSKNSPIQMDRRKSLYRSMRGTLKTKLSNRVERNIMKKHTDYTMPMPSEDEIASIVTNQPYSEDMIQGMIDHRDSQYDDHRQITQDLRSCTPEQEVDVAARLLVCNLRIASYDQYVNRYRSDVNFQPNLLVENVRIDNIRIPLMWKDHLKNRGDHRRFAVFCVLKIGAHIESSEIISPIDRTFADFIFKKPIEFKNVDFLSDISVELYSHLMHRDVSIASTSQKIKHRLNTISDNVGRRVSRRLSGFNEKSLEKTLGPKFILFARSIMKADPSKIPSIKSYSLKIEGDKEVCVPVFTSFCCKVTRSNSRPASLQMVR